MEFVYHGINLKGLKVIKPNKSTHRKKWVYATPSEAVATIFLSKKGNDLYYNLYGNGIDVPITLIERKKGMFKKIFNDFGYIYKIDAKNFKTGLTGWKAEVVSEFEEEVISCRYISNIYDELSKLNKEGKIKLYLYPNRPKNMPLDNSDLIPKVIKWQKNGYDVNNFYELYPELKEKYIEILSEN